MRMKFPLGSDVVSTLLLSCLIFPFGCSCMLALLPSKSGTVKVVFEHQVNDVVFSILLSLS